MAAVGAWAAWEAEFVAAVFNVDAASLPMESPSSGTLLDAALASTLDSLVTLVLNDPTLVRSGTGGLVWMIASWARADAVHTGHADVAASARLSAFLAAAKKDARTILPVACTAAKKALMSFIILALTEPGAFPPQQDSLLPPLSPHAAREHLELAACLMGPACPPSLWQELGLSPPTSSRGGSASSTTACSTLETPPEFLAALLAAAEEYDRDNVGGGGEATPGALPGAGPTVRAITAPLFHEASLRLVPPRALLLSDATDNEQPSVAPGTAGTPQGQAALAEVAGSGSSSAIGGVESLLRGMGWAGSLAFSRARVLDTVVGRGGASASSALDAVVTAAQTSLAATRLASLGRPESFEGWLGLLASLTSSRPLVQGVLLSDPRAGWDSGSSAGAAGLKRNGAVLQAATFVGRLASVELTRADAVVAAEGGAGVRSLLHAWNELPVQNDPDFKHGEQIRGVDARGLEDAAAFLARPGVAPVPSAPSGFLALPRRYSDAASLAGRAAFVQSAVVDAATRGGAAWSSYASGVQRVFENIAKRGGKDELLATVGGLLAAAQPRTQEAFTHCVEDLPAMKTLPRPGALHTLAAVLIGLCEPFLDPYDPKAAKIELGYGGVATASGSGTGSGSNASSGGAAAAVATTSGGSTGADGSSPPPPPSSGLLARVPAAKAEPVFNPLLVGEVDTAAAHTHIDVRNLARQQQFVARQQAMLREMGGAANGGAATPLTPGGLGLSPGGLPSNGNGSAPPNPITEFFFLASHALHVGLVTGLTRANELRGRVIRLKAQRKELLEGLWAHPHQGLTAAAAAAAGGAGSGRPLPPSLRASDALDHRFTGLYDQYLQLEHVLQGSLEAWLMHKLYVTSPLMKAKLPRFFRLQAVMVSRAIAWGSASAPPPPAPSPNAWGGGFPSSPAATPSRQSSSGGASDASGFAGTPAPPGTPRGASSSGGVALTPLRTPGASGGAAMSATPGGSGGAVVAEPLPRVAPSYPLPPPPVSVARLPAYLAADVAEFLLAFSGLFGASPVPPSWLFETLLGPEAMDFLEFCVIGVSSPLALADPYLRGKLVRVLAYVFTPHKQAPWYSTTASARPPPLNAVLGNSPLAASVLLPALIGFHVDIEFSGGHASFYDKFDNRRDTAAIIGYLWQLTHYRDSLFAYALGQAGAGYSESSTTGGAASTGGAGLKSGPARFQRFAAAILSDVGYHMEEALKALNTVRECERLQADAAAWGALAEDARRDEKEKASRAAGMAKYCLGHASEQMALMETMTTDQLANAWVHRQLLDRLAAGLGYYLDQLVGTKRAGLKVRDMGSLGFRPREVVLSLIKVYNNIAKVAPEAAVVAFNGGGGAAGSDADGAAATDGGSGGAATTAGEAPPVPRDPFATAIVRDGRSFHLENYRAACVVLLNDSSFVSTHPDAPDAAKLLETGLIPRLTVAAAAGEAEEEELGDIPDVLADQLVGGLAEDPIRLPSGSIVDRPTAERCLEDGRDPFSRGPLTVLVPVPELREAVNAWKRARRAGDAAAAEAALDDALAIVDPDAWKEKHETAATTATTVKEEAGAVAQAEAPVEAAAVEVAVASAPPPAPAPAPAVAQEMGAEEEDEELAMALALSMAEAGSSSAPAAAAVAPAASPPAALGDVLRRAYEEGDGRQ